LTIDSTSGHALLKFGRHDQRAARPQAFERFADRLVHEQRVQVLDQFDHRHRIERPVVHTESGGALVIEAQAAVPIGPPRVADLPCGQVGPDPLMTGAEVAGQRPRPAADVQDAPAAVQLSGDPLELQMVPLALDPAMAPEDLVVIAGRNALVIERLEAGSGRVGSHASSSVARADEVAMKDHHGVS
jgi:hypothetical protein